LQRGVDFVQQALQHKNNKVFIHCAAGVHRAPMMTLAVLRSLGWSLEDAQRVMQAERPVVDFADVYVQSVELFMCGHKAGNTAKS
jgi:protein-tyrosine phosphatase